MMALVILGCYLIGSIPQAWLLAKLVTGQDLRRMGSGNLGVSNTAVSVSRWAGLFVFVTEAAKGILAVLLVREIGGDELFQALGLLAAIVGTRWSIWMKGAGGRGNTAGIAGLFLIAWPIPVIIIFVWVTMRLILPTSFMATRISLVLWPLIFGLVTLVWWYALFGAVLSLIYLQAQQPDTDDHTLINQQWSSVWAFLTSPRRE
jgi:acyl phosphate:glycerol-3-phosphate acyltransferase